MAGRPKREQGTKEKQKAGKEHPQPVFLRSFTGSICYFVRSAEVYL
jgi:hypothetical protein